MDIPDPRTFTYAVVGGLPLLLDVYSKATPSSNQPRGAIVFFHGGGLAAFARDWLCISVDYRLLPQVKGIDILADITRAWKFIIEELPSQDASFGLDKNKLVVAGQSAGGYLSYLAGAHFDPKPAAVVSMYGPSSFATPGFPHPPSQIKPYRLSRGDVTKHLDGPVTTGSTPSAISPFNESSTDSLNLEVLDEQPNFDDRGILFDYIIQEGTYRECIGSDPKIEPLNYVSKDYPPAVIVHGLDDRVVPFEQSQLAFARFKEVGVKTRLFTVPGADHSFDHFAKARDTSSSKLWSTYLEPVFQCMDAFIPTGS